MCSDKDPMQQKKKKKKERKEESKKTHRAWGTAAYRSRAGGDHASRTELLLEREADSSRSGQATQGRGWMKEAACGQG